MSGSALALALALLITPGPARHRIQARTPANRSPRWIVVLTCLAVPAIILAVAAPAGVAAAVGMVGGTVEIRRRRRLRLRRCVSEATALQGGLDVLVGELRIGAHPVAAFENAAGEVDGRVAASFRAVAARARMGADVAAGISSGAHQSSLPEHWERLAVCWHLAQTYGLAIATLMQTAQRDIVERERFSARVNASMSGARTTAAVLAGLPLLGIGLGQMIGADPLRFLLSGGVGGWLLVIGVALTCTGMLWSDRITRKVAG
jgi:tight adherence protein B